MRHVLERQTARPASTSSTTASSRASASRSTCRSACRASAASSMRPSPRDFDDFPAVHAAAAAALPGRRKRIAIRRRRSARSATTGSARRPRTEYDLFQSALGALPSAARRDVHDRGLARHHRDHDAQRILRLLRSLRLRAGARDAQGIRADRVVRLYPADRCARPRARARALFQDKTDAEFLKIVELQHRGDQRGDWTAFRATASGCTVCWGNWEGPHTHDFPLADCCRCSTRPRSARSASSSPTRGTSTNTRRSKKAKLPPEMILICPASSTPRPISSSIPRWWRNRICEAVAAVGDRSRVIAGVDCGFGTFAGTESGVAETWSGRSSRRCREGADIATRRLWG